MAIGLYAGSFDPPTLGHHDIIRRASQFCDKLIVAVAKNPEKKNCFSVEERVDLLRIECADMSNVEICFTPDAIVNFAKQKSVDILIRGLRTAADLDNERAMSEVNKANGFESIFLITAGQFAHVSSSIVRRALIAKLSIVGMVSKNIELALQKIYDERLK